MNTQSTETADTGAVRSVLYPLGHRFPIRFDLMMDNDVAMRRLAETFGEGSLKYPFRNWKKGFKESVYYNHAMEHLRQYLTGDQSEDHLAHAIWNLCSLCYVQEKQPALLDLTSQPWPPQPQMMTMGEFAQGMREHLEKHPELIIPNPPKITFEYFPIPPLWDERIMCIGKDWQGPGWYIVTDSDPFAMFSAEMEGPFEFLAQAKECYEKSEEFCQ